MDTPATAAQPASRTDYLYDVNGNRTQYSATIGTGGHFLTYAYDALNRLTRVSSGFSGFGQAPAFTYDALSRRTSMTLPSGAIANYTYDAASQLTSLVHSLSGNPIGSLNYTYDAVGNRTAMTEGAGSNTYAYDQLNRLTQASHPQAANPAESFTYDAVGNRLTSHLSPLHTTDAANRLLEDSNFTYTYDENGNLTSKTSGEVTTFTYDAENQLIRVDRPGTVAEYRYDALGRRIEKVVNGVSTRYMYDNEDIVVELDGANTVTALFIHGPGIDEPLAMGRFGAGGGTSVFHADGLGSISTLTDLNGNPVRTYTYDSFGRIVAQTGTFTNPYTYTGRELDPESGIYYYRARYYDPTIGRFLQEDPIATFASSNLYAYSQNDPVNFIDPLGLQRIIVQIDTSSVIKRNEAIRNLLPDFIPDLILDSFFPVTTEEVIGQLESEVSGLVCPIAIGTARFLGENPTLIKIIRRGHLFREAGRVIEVFNTQLSGGLQRARNFFSEQVGRLPTGARDTAVVGGRRFTFRPSRTGPPTVEVIDLTGGVIEKIRFLE